MTADRLMLAVEALLLLADGGGGGSQSITADRLLHLYFVYAQYDRKTCVL
jgi:hypothetical protein